MPPCYACALKTDTISCHTVDIHLVLQTWHTRPCQAAGYDISCHSQESSEVFRDSFVYACRTAAQTFLSLPPHTSSQPVPSHHTMLGDVLLTFPSTLWLPVFEAGVSPCVLHLLQAWPRDKAASHPDHWPCSFHISLSFYELEILSA